MSKIQYIRIITISIRIISLVVVGIFLNACTKTDDYLKELITKHSDFIDPSSVMFRDITYGRFTSLWNVYCGEINAKNRIGGYTGWKPFYITLAKDGEVNVTVIDPNSKVDLSSLGTLYCKDTASIGSSIPFWQTL